MAGIDGLGRRVMAGSQGAQAADLAARLDHLGLQVTPENVLQVGKALHDEGERLTGALMRSRPTLQVAPPGGDPVSGPATEALNEKITALTVWCDAEIAALKEAGLVLADYARAHGKNEQEIEAAFGKIPPGP